MNQMKSTILSARRATPKHRFCPLLVVAVGLGIIFVSGSTLRAQPITVPNFSFESQSGVGYPFGANPSVDSWQKIAEPAYYTPAFGNSVPPWYSTAGVFLGTAPNSLNPYANLLGNQAGYILAFPQVTLFQDYDSSPTHDFDATFEIGKSYNLTIGLFGKNTLPPGSTFQLSLYYHDDLNNKVTVGATTATYSAANFPVTPILNLIDYQVNIAMVQAGDAWAGRHIGIQLQSTIPIELSSGRNWDFDNVRLTAVPEPNAITILALGVGGLLIRMRSRRQA